MKLPCRTSLDDRGALSACGPQLGLFEDEGDAMDLDDEMRQWEEVRKSEENIMAKRNEGREI